MFYIFTTVEFVLTIFVFIDFSCFSVLGFWTYRYLAIPRHGVFIPDGLLSEYGIKIASTHVVSLLHNSKWRLENSLSKMYSPSRKLFNPIHLYIEAATNLSGNGIICWNTITKSNCMHPLYPRLAGFICNTPFIKIRFNFLSSSLF